MSSLKKKIINTPDAPAPVGAYSQAVEAEGTLYISGQLGLDAKSGVMVQGGVAEQAKVALNNMGAILKAADMTPDNVFTREHPARAAYQVAALPKQGLVEIEAVAVRPTK